MMYKACLTSLSTFTLASAFIGVPTPRHADVVPVERLALLRTTTTSLSALIYGWEGDDDSDGPTKTYSDSSESESFGQCTPHGAAVAESLSYDQKRVGSLARLAVAFSPPERALSLDAIEKVEVICVGQDHIDIQAIICEDGGCITLAVPIKFPVSPSPSLLLLANVLRPDSNTTHDTVFLWLDSGMARRLCHAQLGRVG
jgi:hypothetical protein